MTSETPGASHVLAPGPAPSHRHPHRYQPDPDAPGTCRCRLIRRNGVHADAAVSAEEARVAEAQAEERRRTGERD